jgi:hypothetical protein
MSRYFRVIATDEVPAFEPTSQWMGVWSGVCRIEDDALAERLKAAGKTELTEAEYSEELKKKAALRSSFPEFRMTQDQPAVALAAKPEPAPSPKTITIEQATSAKPVPRRQSTAV